MSGLSLVFSFTAASQSHFICIFEYCLKMAGTSKAEDSALSTRFETNSWVCGPFYLQMDAHLVVSVGKENGKHRKGSGFWVDAPHRNTKYWILCTFLIIYADVTFCGPKRGYAQKISTVSVKHYAVLMWSSKKRTTLPEICFHLFPTDPKCHKL